MSVWFVSRHPGAIAWAKTQKLGITHWREHLSIEEIAAGDIVIGTLPVHMAAQVCERKARFIALTINVPQSHRGKEISLDQMKSLNCSLQEFFVASQS